MPAETAVEGNEKTDHAAKEMADDRTKPEKIINSIAKEYCNNTRESAKNRYTCWN